MIHPITGDIEPAVLVLNNEHAEELSWLEPERLSELVSQAFYARRIGNSKPSSSPSIRTPTTTVPISCGSRQRYPRFVYVDRIVVAAVARGKGYARRLYEDLFAVASCSGHETIVCEVNSDPPNPASDAFHAALGFSEVGEAVDPRR